MNIVVIVSGGLTETLQATPLLRSLHAIPGAHITLAAPRRAATLAGGLHTVDEMVVLRALDHRSGPVAWLHAWAELRRRRLDAAVICSDRVRDAALAYAAGIPRRIGITRAGTALLLSDHVRGTDTNNAHSWLRLAGLLGAPAVEPTPDFVPAKTAAERIDGLVSTAGIDPGRILVAMAPGAANADPLPRGVSRLRWEPARYAHLANQLAVRHGAATVLIGPEADRAAVDTTLVDMGAPHLDLCGELDLDETAALLARCDLLVCGDSPLLHIAAAMGTPSVGLFGPTDGRRRAPYGSMHRAVQAIAADGHTAEVARIRVEDVLAGIETTL